MTFKRLLVATLLLVYAVGVQALTPAGTIIKNQASATFKDNTGVQRSVTSNTVETLIQAVGGVVLTQDQSRLVRANSQAVFPHVVTNAGNSNDSFTLQAENTGADSFNFTAFHIHADADQNGVPDSITPITSTPALAPNSSFYFVVVADVPGGLAGGDDGRLSLTATSAFDGGVSMANMDTAVISDHAVIEVTKSISQLSGESPSGPYTVTLSYNNPTASVANSVVLIDALPAGFTYITGSGRWSKSVATVLTDNNPGDAQGSGTDTIIYCSYHTSCNTLPDATQDADSSSVNQVTAILSQVGAGESGTLEFQLSVDNGLAAGGLQNIAEFEFDDGVATTSRQITNPVTFSVNHGAGVVANGSSTSSADGAGEAITVASVSQGEAVLFDNFIWNTGNGVDTFDIAIDAASSSFPAGTVFKLLQSDGLTPLADSSGNGMPDTGPVAAGSFYRVVMRAMLPTDISGDNDGAGFRVTNTATSMADPSVSNIVTDYLGEVVKSTVDVTHNTAIGASGVSGEGAGPEASAVGSLSVDPGGSVVFVLFVNNTSAVADTYTLSASTDSTFATQELPADWSVQFRDTNNNVIGNTGVILPGESLEIAALISVPESQAPLTQSLFIRAQSPTTVATDITHDEVVVSLVSTLVLSPDQYSQTEPGATQTYAHLISNTGNSSITAIDLQLANSLGGDGWSAIGYHDANDNGKLDASDPAIDQIALLASGDSTRILVKVFSPANAPYGAINVTTLSAIWSGGTVSVTGQTTVNQGDMIIVKEQAMDKGCDNLLDSVYTVDSFSLEPGSNCVSYRLTATNSGSSPLYNAVIQDATPAFTTYQPAAVCSSTLCTIVEPAVGATGIVSAEVATILPGESVEFTFAVVLE